MIININEILPNENVNIFIDSSNEQSFSKRFVISNSILSIGKINDISVKGYIIKLTIGIIKIL